MLGGGCSHNFNIPCSVSLHKSISDISQIFFFNRLTSACICNVLRKYILTLGPHFYMFSVFHLCFVNPCFLAGIATILKILLLAVSKHDLKASGTFVRKCCMRPWIRRYRFYWTVARLNYEAYNVDRLNLAVIDSEIPLKRSY